MTTTMFLTLLFGFSVISSVVTEAIKNFVKDKENISYNLVALIVALVIGCSGTAIYYQLNDIAYTVNNIIYLVLMGFASGLTSMVGFDKVKQMIEQLTTKKVSENQ